MPVSTTWIGCSPENFAVGRGGMKPEGVVIHLMDGTLLGTDTWFNTPPEKRGQPPSSAHYGIGKTGEIHQYVKEEDRAYHAGRVLKPTAKLILEDFPSINPNSFTIGIEHEGVLADVWPDEMVEASAALVSDICTRWDIPIDLGHIITHHSVFIQKPCPGNLCPLEVIVQKAAALDVPKT